MVDIYDMIGKMSNRKRNKGGWVS